MCEVYNCSKCRSSLLAFEKNVQQWVLLTNAGRDSDVIEVRGGMCFINVNPNNVQKVMVVNGPCENVYNIPEDLEMLVAKLPRKPYSDDEVLDEQLVDNFSAICRGPLSLSFLDCYEKENPKFIVIFTCGGQVLENKQLCKVLVTKKTLNSFWTIQKQWFSRVRNVCSTHKT